MPTPAPYPDKINALRVTIEPVIEKEFGLEIYQSECAVEIEKDEIKIQVEEYKGVTNLVKITISIPLNNSRIITKDYEKLQNDLDTDDPTVGNDYLNKAFFGFKDVSSNANTNDNEIDTKQMPSLVVTPLEKPVMTASNKYYYDPPSFLLRPSIEDNDTNVNVNLSGTLASKIINVKDEITYHSLLVSVAPPRLGDYVIDGLINADSFRVWTNQKGSVFYIRFDLANAIIFYYSSSSPQRPEGVMELKPDTTEIACLRLREDSGKYFLETIPALTDDCVFSNFSFLVLDSLIIGDAGKLPGSSGKLSGGSGKLSGGSGKLSGGSGKLSGGSGKLSGGSGIVLGGSGIILGGSGKILGGSGKLSGGSAEIFTAG
jgi:X-X-X-Leu-X-X-Gly heptad repeat protein